VIGLDVLGVMASVDFYDQAVLEADEVEIEPQQRRLPTEVESISSHLAKLHPQSDFLRGHDFAQLTSALR
jgi:hypothetical protein